RELGHEITDLGNIEVPVAELDEGQAGSGGHAPFAARIRAACLGAFEGLTGLPAGRLPLTLGGDHSVALATVPAAFRGRQACGGLVWVDAHADVNTPGASVSGNIHGMPV